MSRLPVPTRGVESDEAVVRAAAGIGREVRERESHAELLRAPDAALADRRARRLGQGEPEESAADAVRAC